MRIFRLTEWESSQEFSEFGASCERRYLEYLLELFGKVDTRVGPLHQIEILKSSQFWILGPDLQTELLARHSFILPNKTVFYCFVLKTSFIILGFADISIGSTISVLYLSDEDIAFRLNPSVWGPTQHEISQAAAVFRLWLTAGDSGASKVIAVTGDANFAHHIWNQLGVLDNIAGRHANMIPQTVWVTAEPLGPLDKLYPELAAWTWVRVSDAELSLRNAADRMFVNLSGTLVTRESKMRINTFARNQSSGFVTEWRKSHKSRTIVWISIRSENRRPRNQVKLLAALCEQLLRQSNCDILLDGFSLPADAHTNKGYSQSYFENRIKGDSAIANQVMEILSARSGGKSQNRISHMVGWSLLNTIAIQPFVSFYVCHVGTVQHKIGWFSPVDGIIHCSYDVLKSNPGFWAASQVLGGREATMIPELLVESEVKEESNDERVRSLHHSNYGIKDFGDFVDFVLTIFGRHCYHSMLKNSDARYDSIETWPIDGHSKSIEFWPTFAADSDSKKSDIAEQSKDAIFECKFGSKECFFLVNSIGFVSGPWNHPSLAAGHAYRPLQCVSGTDDWLLAPGEVDVLCSSTSISITNAHSTTLANGVPVTIWQVEVAKITKFFVVQGPYHVFEDLRFIDLPSASIFVAQLRGGPLPRDIAGIFTTLTVHLAHIGDVTSLDLLVGGLRGKSNWIQGFSLTAEGRELAIEYRAKLDDSTWTDWLTDGQYAGTQGQDRALRGFAIRKKNQSLADIQVRYSGAFLGQIDVAEAQNGETCESRSLSKLEVMQIVIKEVNSSSDIDAVNKKSSL